MNNSDHQKHYIGVKVAYFLVAAGFGYGLFSFLRSWIVVSGSFRFIHIPIFLFLLCFFLYFCLAIINPKRLDRLGKDFSDRLLWVSSVPFSLFMIFLGLYVTRQSDPNKTALVQFNAQVKSEEWRLHVNRRHSYWDQTLILEQYPDVEFKSNCRLPVRQGSRLSICVPSDDYHTKVVKDRQRTIFQRNVNEHNVDIYVAYIDGKRYEGVDYSIHGTKFIGWLFVIVGIGIFVYEVKEVVVLIKILRSDAKGQRHCEEVAIEREHLRQEAILEDKRRRTLNKVQGKKKGKKKRKK